MRKGFERQETHPVRRRRNSKAGINVCEDDLVKQSTLTTKQQGREMAESMHRFVFQPKKVVIFACL